MTDNKCPDIPTILARVEKATEGPWEWEYTENEGEYKIHLAHMVLDGSDEDGLPGAFDDRDFIAHAREDVLRLARYALKLEKENTAIRAEAKSWNDNLPTRLKDAEADVLRLHQDKMREWARAEAAEKRIVALVPAGDMMRMHMVNGLYINPTSTEQSQYDAGKLWDAAREAVKAEEGGGG